MNATYGLGVLLADTEISGHMDMNGGWWIVMMIGVLLFWALVIVGIVWLVREFGGSRSARSDPESDPLAVLDRRFAEGGITADDYRERRNVLTDKET